MRERGLSLGAGAIVFIATLIILTNTGVIGIDWPWQKIDVPEVLTEETVVVQPQEATIVEIEPIALDCRARIHAEVPVKGKRDHKALGQTYRTDTVEMTAVGDIDTCVDAADAAVIANDDGTFRVVVPADAVTFERPRIDAVATMDSVEFDKGLVGKVTDVLPWVSDDSGLTPAAYAFAQQVVGSSSCMEQAWDVTAEVIVTAYEDQLVAQGGDPADIEVDIVGTPDFGEPPATDQGGFQFAVEDAAIQCSVDGQAYTADVILDPSA